MRWSDEELDRAMMLVAAIRAQHFGNVVESLAARFRLNRDDAAALYKATQAERS